MELCAWAQDGIGSIFNPWQQEHFCKSLYSHTRIRPYKADSFALGHQICREDPKTWSYYMCVNLSHVTP